MKSSVWTAATQTTLACLIVILSACSSTVGGRASLPKTLGFALSLRGLNQSEVVSKMGSEPAESMPPSQIAYYFLSEESENHPSPKAIRYRFVFKKGILVSVEPEKTNY